jgi:hypothetical protein
MRAFVLFVEHGPPGRGLSIGQVPVENGKSTGNLPGKWLWAPVRERPRGGPSFQPPPPSSWLQCPHARIRSSAIRPIVSSTSSMVPWFWFTNTVTTVGPPSWKMIPVSLRT